MENRYLPRLHDTAQRRHGVLVGDVVHLNLFSRTSVFLVIVVRGHCPEGVPAHLLTQLCYCIHRSPGAHTSVRLPQQMHHVSRCLPGLPGDGLRRIQPQNVPLTARMWLLDVDLTPARFSGPGLMTQVASMPHRAACQTRRRAPGSMQFRLPGLRRLAAAQPLTSRNCASGDRLPGSGAAHHRQRISPYGR